MLRPRLPTRAASPRRWVLCAGLLAGGFVVGGGVGTLMVIGAVFAVLDAVIPIPRSPQAEAEDRFARLARSRRRHASPLDIVDDGSGPLAAAPRRELGVQLIPIESITATTEASKARLFDRGFRPDRSTEGRWKSLWMAEARGLDLPPIAVYRIGERHVLRDGHHRVSVARDHGRAEIDAEVVELTTSRSTSASAPPSRPTGR
jgi:hypothetical protein